MSQNEAIALVKELGASPQQLSRLRSILSRMLSETRPASVLTALTAPQAPVFLGPTASQATFTPAPLTLDLENLATETRGQSGGEASQRYETLRLLGRGGMGEVHRVLDTRRKRNN